MEQTKLNQLLSVVYNYGKDYERTKDPRYGFENAIKHSNELDYKEKEKINPTSKEYYTILNKYWKESGGEKVVLMFNKRGNFCSNKENVIRSFFYTNQIDAVITKLFFDKKILIARPSGTYWGVTCTKQPTIEMMEELRKEANKIKAHSRKNVDKIKKIEEESNLFKYH